MLSEDVETPPRPTKSAENDLPDYANSATRSYATLAPLIVLICVLACASVFLVWAWGDFVSVLFEAIESSENKVAQAMVINSALVVMIVCCLPGSVFCLILDGFFFGFWKGFALAFVFETIGYLLCICFARTCLQARLREMIMENAVCKEMILICEEDSSGKFLMLFRFLTLPVWANNYCIGMLDIDWLKAFLIFVPAQSYYAAIYAYIGSKSYIAADALRKGDTLKVLDSFSGAEVIMVCVSVSVAVLLLVLGWKEYGRRRDKLTEGAHSESSSLNVAKAAR
mmetsp:Transcript_33019/g.51258  ORF Transcript_33019/g.51258 Transcript_33019/m.51258 type:complete len:283 (+) Transcript_33019:115-963(+)